MLISDNELIGKYLFADDPQAFEELVRRHSGLVMGVCRNMLWHAHDAEDAFQGTFLILSKKATSLVNHGSIAGWLYQVAVRNCLQIRRRKGRARETEMIEEPVVGNNEPWLTISQNQEHDLIYQEINRLPKNYRDVIVLCHLQGHSRSEAAELLDQTETAIKAALARGRNLLRRRLIRSGLLTSALLVTLRSSTVAADEMVSESLIDATLETCQGLTPTVSVGTNPQFVQSLANQGVMSMQATTFVKSIAWASGLAIAALIPIAVIAQQFEKSQGPDTLFVSTSNLVGSQDQGGDLAKDNATVQVAASAADDEILATTSNDSDDLFFHPNQYSIENSEEYWKLMKESFSLRASALRDKARSEGLADGEQQMMMADSFEMHAKVVEADLNLKRIKNMAKAAEAGKAKSTGLNNQQPAAGENLQFGNLDIYSSNAKIPPASSDPVQPGEVLLVEIRNSPDLNRRVTVQADYSISMPVVGTINVRGMDPSRISKLVSQRLVEFLKEPQVFVCRESASMPVQSRMR